MVGQEGDGPMIPPAALQSILFLTAVFFVNFLSRIVLSPLLPVVERDLGISHGEAGSLFLLISLGYGSALFFGGLLSSRLTHRRVVLIASAALGFSLLLVSRAGSLPLLRSGFVFMGFFAGIYLPSGMATITTLVCQRNMGKAIAIHEMAPSLAYIIAPGFAGTLLCICTWREILSYLGISAILAGLLYAAFGRGGDFRGEFPGIRNLGRLFRQRDYWIMVALFGLGIGTSMGTYAMLPLYLVNERGLGADEANRLIALSRAGSLAFAFIAGWVTDRLGPWKTIGGVMVLSGTLTSLLGLVPSGLVGFMVFLQPLVNVCFFTAGFAALTRIGPSRARNITVSMTVLAGYIIGAGAIPAGIGYAGDAGSFGTAIAGFGLLVAGSPLLLRYLRLSPLQDETS